MSRLAAPRRVLFFTTSLGGGGAESHTLRVLNQLDRSRFVPRLAVVARGGSYEQFLAPDVPVDGLAASWLPSSTARLLTSVVSLRRLIERSKPDLVCSVMDLPNIVALTAVAGMRRKPKMVACVQITPTSELTRYTRGRLVIRAMRSLYPGADRVIALSRGVGNELASLIPSASPRIRVIYNACVDDRLLSARADGEGVPETRRAVVLGVGRFTEQKGFAYLIDSFARVREHHDAELWLLGEGPLREELEERARQRGVLSRVRFLGFRSNPQDFMRRATVFVLSSLWEGFGNVVVEALACGTPVVSTLCPHGPGEVLTHERTGLCVPVADADALAVAIARVLAEPDLRSRLSREGPNRAMDFSATTISEQYGREFERVLDEPD